MNDEAQALIKRYHKLRHEVDLWLDIWQDCADYSLPNYDVSVRRSPGQKRTQKLYDSTAVHAAELLAASLQANLTSMAARWFSLVPRDQDAVKSVAIMSWLEDCANRMYSALQSSNFATEIHEAFTELTIFGTTCILCEQAPSGVVFKTYPVSYYAIDENEYGLVDTVFRKYKLSSRNAVSRWGKDAPEKIRDADPDKTFEFLHAVYPSKEKLEDGSPFWESIWLCMDTKEQVAKGRYMEMPYAVPRWLKATGERFGRSPTMTALPDIKTLNKAIELELRAWAKAIDPPLMVRDDGVIGDVNLTPGSLTVVRDKDTLLPIVGGTQWQITELKKTEIRENIKNIYYYAQLSVPDALRLSATEVHLKWQMVERLLGSVLGRIQAELLSPIVDRIFGILYRSGYLAPAPSNTAGIQLDITFESPMAQAQRMAPLQNIDTFIAEISKVGQLSPGVFDNVNFDVIIRSMYRMMSLPQEALKEEGEVESIRANREGMLQQAIQLQSGAGGNAGPQAQVPVPPGV
jgi:hypothetical protein